MKSSKRILLGLSPVVMMLSLASLPVAYAAAPNSQSPAEVMKKEAENRKDAEKHIAAAVEVARKMTADADVAALLKQAKGVLIVPRYVRAGLIVGGHGGEGVLLFKRDGKWSGPMLYRIGGVSLGLEAGAEAGPMALLLMNDKAASRAMTDNNFSLNADAGLTLVNYSARKQVGVEKGDIVVWSDTKGAFANASISLTDVGFDSGENMAYYNSKTEITSQRILNGEVTPPSQELQRLLP